MESPARPRPLRKEAILAANRLYEESLPDWRASDEALDQVGQVLKDDFSEPSCLIKAATVNGLYAAGVRYVHLPSVARALSQVLSPPISRVAEHIVDLIIDKIYECTMGDNKHLPRYRAFASKFAHFFFSPELAIWDRFGEAVVRYHRGGEFKIRDLSGGYQDYCKRVGEIRRNAPDPDRFTARELDRYLWLSGQLRAWKTHVGLSH